MLYPEQGQYVQADILPFCSLSDVSNTLDELSSAERYAEILEYVAKHPENFHHTLPLIYTSAKKSGILEKLKEYAQQQIKSQALALLASELTKTIWLEHISKALVENGISVILLKGAAFANALYHPDSPRPSLDLDILVRRRDFEKACEILDTKSEPVIIDTKRIATHRNLFERVFRSRKNPSLLLELHRGLTNPYIFTIEEEELWRDSRIHPAYGCEQIRMLSPEDTLLHLAVHAFRDMDFRQHSVLDAYQVITQLGIDEDDLFLKSQKWGATSVLYQLLFQTQRILGPVVSNELMAAITPGKMRQCIQTKTLGFLQNRDSGHGFARRIVQIVSQYIFPDRLTAVIKFHLHYASLRLMDLSFQARKTSA